LVPATSSPSERRLGSRLTQGPGAIFGYPGREKWGECGCIATPSAIKSTRPDDRKCAHKCAPWFPLIRSPRPPRTKNNKIGRKRKKKRKSIQAPPRTHIGEDFGVLNAVLGSLEDFQVKPRLQPHALTDIADGAGQASQTLVQIATTLWFPRSAAYGSGRNFCQITIRWPDRGARRQTQESTGADSRSLSGSARNSPAVAGDFKRGVSQEGRTSSNRHPFLGPRPAPSWSARGADSDWKKTERRKLLFWCRGKTGATRGSGQIALPIGFVSSRSDRRTSRGNIHHTRTTKRIRRRWIPAACGSRERPSRESWMTSEVTLSRSTPTRSAPDSPASGEFRCLVAFQHSSRAAGHFHGVVTRRLCGTAHFFFFCPPVTGAGKASSQQGFPI